MGTQGLGFNPPKGRWAVTVGALVLPAGAMVSSSKDYRVVVYSLCGVEEATVDCAPKSACSVADFARQVQLIVSGQHVHRNGCTKCLELWGSVCNAYERRFIVASAPRLGKILGLGVEGGGA